MKKNIGEILYSFAYKKIDNKGFAITGILYSIFLLVVVFLVLLLSMMANTYLSYTQLQKEVKNKLDEVEYAKDYSSEPVIPKVSLKVTKKNDQTEVKTDTWSNQELVYIFKKIKEGKMGSIIYYCVDTEDTCSPDIEVENETVPLDKTGIYYVRYKIVSKAGIENPEIKSYKAKVDTTAPTIKDIKVTYTDDTATIRVLASDEEGSGIEAYCLTTVNDSSQCNWISSTEAYQDFPDQEINIYYVFVKDKVGNISNSKLAIVAPKPTTLAYTEGEQTYIVPITGYYKLEVWGAQGGTAQSSVPGGKGGYSVGVAYLTKGQTLYINVGGQGKALFRQNASVAGGYNGGGNGHSYEDKTVGSGGGATHIATVSGQLSSLSSEIPNILIVAGGGGGSGYQDSSYYGAGGAGGGIYGIGSSGGGGTQALGGGGAAGGFFGQGASNNSNGTGGGGGFYGGGSGQYYGGGGGGSSYISGVMSYGDITAQTIAGNASMPSPSGDNEIGHAGNGSAQIAFVAYGNPPDCTNFVYTGSERTYVAPKTGYYKLEVWGAQGGYSGGKGGYSVGVAYLTQGQTLYINVGGYGKTASNQNISLAGGYNGGGNAHGYTDKIVGSGGGATHIATVSGQLSSFSNQIQNILIVAGGGGGSGYQGGGYTGFAGGAGGGIHGISSGGGGGTQSSGGGGAAGGSFGQGASNNSNGTGGGGGYFGGGSGQYFRGAGGGSGYIGGVITYRDITAQTIAGDTSMPNPLGGNEIGHAENGYAQITFISEGEPPNYILPVNFIYLRKELAYTVPKTGYYKLEVWGAQGGYYGGGGGYSVGVTHLTEGQTLYVNVGGSGQTVSKQNTSLAGGYNGGGNAHGYTDKTVGSGGGATHIATVSGQLSSLSTKISNILIVAGGGGGSGFEDGGYTGAGGAGGGINGISSSGGGGTQTAGGGGVTGGSFGQGASNNSNGTGGGGGFYGGGSGQYFRGAGGGSGYIDGVMSYGDITAQTIAGNATFPNIEGTADETGHAGHGYARITYIGE